MDLQTGLSEFAVTQRRLVHGWNEFVADNTEPVWKKYLGQVGLLLLFLPLTSVRLAGRRRGFGCGMNVSLGQLCCKVKEASASSSCSSWAGASPTTLAAVAMNSHSSVHTGFTMCQAPC